MDLVDAISEWVDRQDDELSDDERRSVVRLQLAIDSGPWGGVEVHDLVAADLAELKASLVSLDSPEFVAWLVDGAHGDHESTRAVFDDLAGGPSTFALLADGEAHHDTADRDTADRDTADRDTADQADEADRDTADRDTADRDTADQADEADRDTADQADEADDLAKNDDFFASFDSWTESADEDQATELSDGPDLLGPAFLPEAEKEKGVKVSDWLFGVVIAAALTAFVIAGMYLVAGIGGEATVEQVNARPRPTTEPTSEPEPNAVVDEGSEPGVSEADGGDVEAEGDERPEPSATPPGLRAESQAVVLTASGDVVAIDLLAGGVGEPISLRSADDFVAATTLSEVDEGLAVVDERGDIYLVDLHNPDDAIELWDSDDFGRAATITDIDDRYAVLESTGSISLFPIDEAASDDNLDRVWDTSVGGTAPARQVDSINDLLPFVLQSGEVRLYLGRNDSMITVWDAEALPRAFNIDTNAHGVHLGVGQGAVARYNLLETAGPVTIAMWDPTQPGRLPAIGYAGTGDEAAIVLNDGSVVLVDETGDGLLIWDPEEHRRPAIAVTASDDEILLILEDGSIVRAGEGGYVGDPDIIWDGNAQLGPAMSVIITGG